MKRQSLTYVVAMGLVVASASAQVIYPEASQSEPLTAPKVEVADPVVEVDAVPLKADTSSTSASAVAPSAPAADAQSSAANAVTSSAGALSTGGPSTAASPVSNVTTNVTPVISVPSAQTAQQVQVAPSEVDSIKNQRLKKEGDTNNLIHRRIEEGRMRDEEARLNTLNQVNASVYEAEKAEQQRLAKEKQEAEAKAAAIQAQQQQQQAAPVVVIQQPSEEKKSSNDENSMWRQISVGPLAGYTWYDTSSLSSQWGVQNNYTVGLVIDVPFSDFFSVQGNFTYADYDINYGGTMYGYAPYGYYGSGYLDFDKHQYMAGIDAKLNIPGRFRPYIGGGFNYVMNEGVLRNSGYYSYYTPGFRDSQTFHYIAGDLMAGVDISLTKNINVGGRFQYISFLGQNNQYNFFGGFNEYLINDVSDMYRAMGTVTVSF